MIGKTVGGYQILEQIGEGGMATVYKAYDAGTDRHVAIKTLPQHYAGDAEFIKRFEIEARAIARLEHLHILPIFAYGEEEGVTYMAMRYMDTGTLTDYLSQQPLSFAEAGRLLKQIASALDYAHAQQIIHRDVKPTNILLDDNQNAFLTDFGIAKMLQSSTQLTQTGSLVGTPQYMAPEQFDADQQITAKADQFALGIIAYEMVAGVPPYVDQTPWSIIGLHQREEPLPSLREYRPDLPFEAEQAILKALSRQAESRYRSCTEFANAFAEALTGITQPNSTKADTLDTNATMRGYLDSQSLQPLPDSQTKVTTDELPVRPSTIAGQSNRRLLLFAGLIGIAIIAFVVIIIPTLNQTDSPAETPSTTQEVVAENNTPSPTAIITPTPINFEVVDVDVPSNWERSSIENISIGIPPGWNELSIDELIGIVNSVFDSNDMSLMPVYAPNVDMLIGNWLEFSGVGIVIDDLGLTLPHNLVQDRLSQLTTTYGGEVAETKPIRINGQELFMAEGDLHMSEFEFWYQAYSFSEGNFLYTLSFVSFPANVERNQSIIQQMIASIEFDNN